MKHRTPWYGALENVFGMHLGARGGCPEGQDAALQIRHPVREHHGKDAFVFFQK
jgi:hypothetical protein